MAAPPDPLPRYKYKNLSIPNSLRLLRLRSAAATQDAVKCELFESQLENTDLFQEGTRREDYEAVSWCWGNMRQDQPLRVIEGEQAYSFFNSKDLEAALRALRYHDKTRLLWVDQICIYLDRSRTKSCRNLRIAPPFCEGFGFHI